MSPVRIFHRYRGLKNFTMDSLLDAAGDLIPALIGSQSRYKVSELPTVRTVRYYMSQGLVDKPAGRRGTLALYSYRHLLQILAVKHLQTQYLPLRRIKVLLRDVSNRELEQLLPGGRSGAAKGRAPAEGNGAPAAKPPPHPLRQESPSGAEERGDPSPNRWVRIRISEGVELHLRDDKARELLSPRTADECRRALGEALRAGRPGASYRSPRGRLAGK